MMKSNTLEDPLVRGLEWGWCLSLDLRECPVETISDKKHIQQYVVILCDDYLKAKRFGPTWLEKFGEKTEIQGYSMVQMIEVSSVSGHFAENLNAAFIDIFSCAYYDKNAVIDFTKDWFQAKRSESYYFKRYA